MMRVAIMASGRGSNAKSLWQMSQQHPEWVHIALLICDNPDAEVLNWARSVNIPAVCVPKDKSMDKNTHEQQILARLRQYQIEWVCLAGYMRLLSDHFIKSFYESSLGAARILNIHPSLLPSFPGKDGYGDAYRAGVQWLGITVHFVDTGVDTGPIIAQQVFERYVHDDLASIKTRGLTLEHQLYPQVLLALAQGKLKQQLLASGERYYYLDQVTQ